MRRVGNLLHYGRCLPSFYKESISIGWGSQESSTKELMTTYHMSMRILECNQLPLICDIPIKIQTFLRSTI